MNPANDQATTRIRGWSAKNVMHPILARAGQPRQGAGHTLPFVPAP